MKNLYFILTLVFIMSCHSDRGENLSMDHAGSAQAMSKEMAIEEMEYNEEQQSFNQNQASSIIARKIIKNADLRFQVQDLEVSTTRIQQIAETHNGYVSNMSQNNSNYSFNNHLQVKIPEDKFDAFLTAIEAESIYTDYKNINSNDVTEEFTDITIRLKTKKEVRDRYIDILRNKAKTVKDILDAEDKIRRIQEEIESMEGRLKYLNDRVSYSNVSIQIYQRVEGKVRKDIYSKSFLTKAKESFVRGGELFVGMILFFINMWPIFLLGLFLYFFRGKISGLFRRRRKE